MPSLDTIIDRLDRFQQRHKPLAIAWAVQRKYGDDRGGNLSALIAYYGLSSVFPLILVVVSLALYVVSPGSATLRSLESHLASVPVIGPSLGQVEQHRLGGSVIAVAIGAVALLWGAQGLAQTLQYAMNEVWDVPEKQRAGFVARQASTAKFYLSFGLGIVISTYLSSLSSIFNLGPAGPVMASIPALVLNAAVFTLSFRVLSPPTVTTRELLPGGCTAGFLWTVLTGIGVGLVTHQFNHASALYGSIGVFLGLMGFLYLAARLTLYCAEFNVVRTQHLWPRSIQGHSLPADRQQLRALTERTERVNTESVVVEL